MALLQNVHIQHMKSCLLLVFICSCLSFVSITLEASNPRGMRSRTPPDFGEFYYLFANYATQFQNNRSAELMELELKNGTVNPHPFVFTILERDTCKNKSDLFMLVILHTAAQNLNTRNRIRRTWGSRFLQKKLKFVVIFAVGLTNDQFVAANLIRESFYYRDIIQENFMDTYRNLTYKSIMWLRWAADYCPNAKYLMKIDDDIFVNIFKMVDYLRAEELESIRKNEENKRKIFCTVWHGGSMPVIRDKFNKWYIPKEDYENNAYGTYCSGWAYTMTQNLVRPMYEASFSNKFFWVDDFYTTGVLPRNLSATYVDMIKYFPFGKNLTDNVISKELMFQWIGYMSDEVYFKEFKSLVPPNFLKNEKALKDSAKLAA